MGLAPPVGRVFFPLDEELALLPGNLAPRQQEHLVHLASWMPFAHVGQMLERLLGVQVSEETVRRLTEQAGAQLEAVQTAQAKAPMPEEGKADGVPARLAISADGACVPLAQRRVGRSPHQVPLARWKSNAQLRESQRVMWVMCRIFRA